MDQKVAELNRSRCELNRLDLEHDCSDLGRKFIQVSECV